MEHVPVVSYKFFHIPHYFDLFAGRFLLCRVRNQHKSVDINGKSHLRRYLSCNLLTVLGSVTESLALLALSMFAKSVLV